MSDKLWLETVSADKLPYVKKAMESWNRIFQGADPSLQWSELGWNEKNQFLNEVVKSSTSIWHTTRIMDCHWKQDKDDQQELNKLCNKIEELNFILPELKEFHDTNRSGKIDIGSLHIGTFEIAGRLMMTINIDQAKETQITVIAGSSQKEENRWGLQSLYGYMEDFYAAIDLVKKEWNIQNLCTSRNMIV